MSPNETMTALELAELLHEVTGSSIPTIVRMVRHYTAHGLIPVVGDVNTGTGRSRSYPREGYLYAAILLHLNELGVSIGPLTSVSAAIAVLEKRKRRSIISLLKKHAAPCIGIGVKRAKDGSLSYLADDFELTDSNFMLETGGNLVIIRMAEHLEAAEC